MPVGQGLNLERLLLIRGDTPGESLWACEQALRSMPEGIVLALMERVEVSGFELVGDRVTAVMTDSVRVPCETLVLALTIPLVPVFMVLIGMLVIPIGGQPILSHVFAPANVAIQYWMEAFWGLAGL